MSDTKPKKIPLIPLIENTDQLIDLASRHYADDALSVLDCAGLTARKKDDADETLAVFVARELRETFGKDVAPLDRIHEAIRVMSGARSDLDGVVVGLEDYLVEATLYLFFHHLTVWDRKPSEESFLAWCSSHPGSIDLMDYRLLLLEGFNKIPINQPVDKTLAMLEERVKIVAKPRTSEK